MIELAARKGVLLISNPGGSFIKIAPPLTIEEDALIEGLEVVEECFAEACSS